VSSLATRLLDASATLDAADRALLNIWVKRDLGDAELARMTGMSEETIADRRARIVEHLSATLGLPPDSVRSELTEIAAASAIGPGAAANAPAAPAAVAHSNGATPRDLPTWTTDEPAPSPPGDSLDTDAGATPALAPESRRRRWRWSALGLLAIVVAVVLVVSLQSGGSVHHRGPASRPASASATQTVPPTPSTSPAPSPTASRPSSEPLVTLPHGPDHGTGTVRTTGSGSHLKLYLSVSDLPAAAHGHYEIWLYDSLVYSEALGRLRAGVTHVSFRLPANAGRFHWIDISFQPVGTVFHSGESVLRSANPAFATATARRP
jgi:hypothetical protein